MKKILLSLLWSINIFGFTEQAIINKFFPSQKNIILSESFDSLTSIENYDLLHAEQNYNFYGISGEQLFHRAKALYEKSILEIARKGDTYKIPKIIHQIWLGSACPERYKKWQAQIKRMHPDWEYILWTDKDVEKLQLVNGHIYKNAKNFGEKSDLARYEILYRFGGVYLDCDIECFQNLDQLHKSFHFYAGFEPFWAGSESRCFTVGNAIIASCAQHPIILECIENIKKFDKQYFPTSYKMQTVMKTGPMMFTRSCIDTLSKELSGFDNIIFPSKLLYPDENYCKQYTIRPFFRHYWTHSWLR